jgi:hypothetical protein
MNSDSYIKLSKEQNKSLIEFLRAISRSKLKDPDNPPTPIEAFRAERRGNSYYKDEAFDFTNPTSRARDQWEYYLMQIGYEAATEREASTKTIDTTRKRLKAVNKLKKILGHWPTSADLENTFSGLPKLDRTILEMIDKDLEYLKSPPLPKFKSSKTTKRPSIKKRNL